VDSHADPFLGIDRAHIKITLNCLSCHADWQTSKQEKIRILLIGVVVEKRNFVDIYCDVI